jgi:type VI secretion system protein ImpH
MRPPSQQPAAGLIERLLAEPQRFEFFQAVRLLLLWLGEQGVPPRRPASAVVLARVLSHHFGVPVALEEAVGHWDLLFDTERSMLGGANAVLGQAAVIGERCWRPDLRARVRIGPLSRAEFERFLPRASGARALNTLLGLFAAPTIVYEVVLVLSRTELRPARLEGGPQRLGRDSYLLTRTVRQDRADMVYEMRPMPPLPPGAAAFADDDSADA